MAPLGGQQLAPLDELTPHKTRQSSRCNKLSSQLIGMDLEEHKQQMGLMIKRKGRRRRSRISLGRLATTTTTIPPTRSIIATNQLAAEDTGSKESSTTTRMDRRQADTSRNGQQVAAILAAVVAVLVVNISPSAATSHDLFAGSRNHSQLATNHQPAQQQAATGQSVEGDLIAIGGITLLDPSRSTGGRLIDQIASSPSSSSSSWPTNLQTPEHNNKLDYIIDFMRANKLTKFCDLLTGNSPEVRNLSRQLNSMAQFTLFVPTNEALLLLERPSIEQIQRRPGYDIRHFLMAHATSELVVPRLVAAGEQPDRASLHSVRWRSSGGERLQSVRPSAGGGSTGSTSNTLMFSLAGTPLRVTTAPITTATNGTSTSTKLELIVNGANVLSGHSHALQEPNNSSATYAIVHLIDRSLWPAPSSNLLDKIRLVAPKFAQLLRLDDDPKLAERLSSINQQTSAFVPTDEALRTVPSKLLDQLETNRTFLATFLRHHLVDGIYFSGQLLSHTNANLHPNEHRQKQLVSLAGGELNFETKQLPTRNLLLVNSIPVTELDSMALNGVVHVLSRPLFERRSLEECQCGGPEIVNKKPSAGGQLLNANEIANTSNNKLLNDLSQYESSTGTGKKQVAPNWFSTSVGRPTVPPSVSSNELEREESRVQQQQQESSLIMSNQRVRQQRSGNLVGLNNKNFYRPSTAPVNLQLHADDQPGSGVAYISDQSQLLRLSSSNNSSATLNAPTSSSTSSSTTNDFQMINGRRGNQLAPTPINVASSNQQDETWNKSSLAEQLFDVDRYKVVLNATLRQKMREQQLQQLQLQSQAQVKPATAASNHQFAYDQPLATTSTTSTESSLVMSNNRQRPYSRLPTATNESSVLQFQNSASAANDQVSPSASTNRQQRLLKFQVEEAVQAAPTNRSSSMTQFQAAYDVVVAEERRQQAAGKTVAPGASFGGCAFYDAECKRLLGKLSRLPQINPQNSQQQQQQVKSFIAHQANNNTLLFGQQNNAKNLDSTFGEATTTTSANLKSTEAGSRPATRNPSLMSVRASNQRQQIMAGPFVGSQPSDRLSPLNQPLPPWSDDEHLANSSTSSSSGSSATSSGQLINRIPGTSLWRAQDLADISRIRLASSKLSQPGNNNNNNNDLQNMQPRHVPQTTATAQILLVPVKMFKDASMSLQPTNQRPNQTASPIYFAPPVSSASFSSSASAPIRSSSSAQQTAFTSNSQFHRPTPLTSSTDTNNAPFVGRLSNFSAFEPVEEAPANSQGTNVSPQLLNQQTSSSQRQTLVRAPLQAFRKSPVQVMNESFQQHQQQQADVANGIKQARKLVRQQVFGGKQPDASGGDDSINSDFSITSARLTNRWNSTASGGLATQASNQAPNQFVGHLNQPNVAAGSTGQTTAGDFFQNRTIAEIMDDSGLRIDGQQVTFNRLKDCLQTAELANLVRQEGSSLTIFMPTDAAFQRLVQQQALAQQQQQRANPSRAARLSDSTKARHFLPLVAKVDKQQALGSNTATTSASRARLVEDDDHLFTNANDLNSLTSRLTLDCASPQVRQLLLDHLSSQLVTPRQLVADTGLSALSGHRLLLSSVPSKKIVVVDGQPVIAATRAKNGMVYVLNKFLNLTQQVPNVVELIESQPQLSTFQSYLAFSSLADRLKRESGPITVLAPTNEAFEQLSQSARQLINSDPAALADILRGHIVEGAQFGKLVSMRNKLKTMNTDQMIEAKVIRPNVYQLDNQLTSIRLLGTAGNGVVNSIDRLIVPPWLRVSMGARPTSATLAVTNNNPNSIAATNAASANLLRQPTLNLPVLNNQPLSFDQPEARLAQPANSFLLAGPTTSTVESNNNNLLDSFDVPSIEGDERQANNRFSPSSSSSSSSPFSSQTNNNGLTTSSPPSALPGNRLTFPSQPFNGSDQNNDVLASNVSKNMQLINKLATLMKHKKFVRYLMKSRLSEHLKADMNYVILVPTDQAVEKLPKQIIQMLDNDPERLMDLVNYHVLDTTFEYINTIPDGQTLNTLNEKDILFNWHRNNTILTASGAVVLGGIQEENIALLIVDRVLYPTPGDLLSIISKSPILSNFTQLIRNARLEKQLTLSGPYTLFAPSDIAFNQLERRDLDYLQRNPETARRFLLRHLSQPAIFTSSIALSNATITELTTSPNIPAVGQLKPLTSSALQVPSLSVTNSLGEDLQLRQRNDYFSVNDVNFSYADVAATNGVMHVIEGLL